MLLCTLVMNKWNDSKLMYVRKYSACSVCVAVTYVCVCICMQYMSNCVVCAHDCATPAQT